MNRYNPAGKISFLITRKQKILNFKILFNIILATKCKKISSKVDSFIKKLQGEIYTYTYVYGKR